MLTEPLFESTLRLSDAGVLRSTRNEVDRANCLLFLRFALRGDENLSQCVGRLETGLNVPAFENPLQCLRESFDVGNDGETLTITLSSRCGCGYS